MMWKNTYCRASSRRRSGGFDKGSTGFFKVLPGSTRFVRFYEVRQVLRGSSGSTRFVRFYRVLRGSSGSAPVECRRTGAGTTPWDRTWKNPVEPNLEEPRRTEPGRTL